MAIARALLQEINVESLFWGITLRPRHYYRSELVTNAFLTNGQHT
jgi:hypothetical protein